MQENFMNNNEAKRTHQTAGRPTQLGVSGAD